MEASDQKCSEAACEAFTLFLFSFSLPSSPLFLLGLSSDKNHGRRPAPHGLSGSARRCASGACVERASEGVEELTERRERHLSAAMTAGIKKFSCLHIRFGLCSKASFRHSLALFTALDTRETCIVDGRREINDKQSIAAVLLKLTNFIMKKKTRKKNRPTPPSSPPPRPLLLRLQASRSRSWAPEEASASPSACF